VESQVVEVSRSTKLFCRLTYPLNLIASIFISILILEVGSFIYFSTIKGYRSLETVRRYEYDAYRGYRLRPHYKDNGTEHNAQGFRRSKSVTQKKHNGMYRIILMGGSTAYGMPASGVFGTYPISNNETIDYYLELFLNKVWGQQLFEVINAAVPGYWTHQHLIYLNQELLAYGPDMVIFLDGHNDHYILDKNHKQFQVNYRTDHIQEMNNPTALGVSEHLLSYLATKSWFGLGLMISLERIGSWKAVKVHGNKFAGNIDHYEEIAEETVLKMIKRNVLILKDERIIPVVLLQPELALFQEKRFTTAEKELLEIELRYRQEGYQELLDGLNKKASRMISLLAKEYQFFFLDLRNVFKDLKEEAYIDYIHLSPAGARHLAEHVGRKIIPLIESDITAAKINRSKPITCHVGTVVLPGCQS
jgi:lysophospholipase L1-like esterase